MFLIIRDSWKAVVLVVLLVSTQLLAEGAPDPHFFDFEDVRELARARAAKDYEAQSSPELPEFLRKLDYDQYHAIRFRPEQTPWQGEGLPFKVQFFHRGYIYTDPVRIHLVENGQVREVNYFSDQFNFGANRFPKPLPPDLRFAGVQVIYAAPFSGNQNEVASFLGASYFRLVGTKQRFGASARGLAIDTAEAKGEEFPRFTEFWIEKPQKYASTLVVLALLDSPGVAGAYRFVIIPGENTTVSVEAALFSRKELKKIGFAPLTSMFWMGENRTRYVPDFRPEVHDSDGMLLQKSSGQWIWRPLVNPQKTHHVSSFPVDDLVGFGLLQRDRHFICYEDLESRFELRPTLWVRPESNWGPGAVELVEIPTPTEYNDNIVAYWVPKENLPVGKEFRWSYSMSAILNGPQGAPLLRVQATRITPEHQKAPPRFVIDLEEDAPMSFDGEPLAADVRTTKGEIRNLNIIRNEVTRGWRVVFDLDKLGNEAADLNFVLKSGDRVVSETWTYHFESSELRL